MREDLDTAAGLPSAQQKVRTRLKAVHANLSGLSRDSAESILVVYATEYALSALRPSTDMCVCAHGPHPRSHAG